MNIRNDLNVAINLKDFSVLARVLLKVAEPAFLNFPLRDLSNVNCWLATILSQDPESTSRLRGISLLYHTISITNLTVNMRCMSCSSPKFDDLLASLYSIEDIEEATSIVREKSNELYEGEFLQVLLDHVVVDAAKQCPHRLEYDPNATAAEYLKSPGKSLSFAENARDASSIYFNIANSVFAVCLLVVGVLGRRMVHRQNCKWIDSLSADGAYLLSKQQAREREREQTLNIATTSLFCSRYIPKRVRIAVPMAILLNTALYMAGHLGVLSTVNLEASLAGEAFTIHNFLEFSFIKSTRETYRNGGSEMAILIWIFSGIWPYIKLILSALAWMLPPDKLSVSRRGRMLLWIDAMAKLSVVDIFTMMLGVAVLLVYVGGPDKSLAKEDALYTMKAIVRPGAGCYCLLIAQRLARVSSRYFLDYHQQVIDMATAEQEANLRFQDETTSSNEGNDVTHNVVQDFDVSQSTIKNSADDEQAGPENVVEHRETSERIGDDVGENQPIKRECKEFLVHLDVHWTDESTNDEGREQLGLLARQNDESVESRNEARVRPLLLLENGHSIPASVGSKDEECSSGGRPCLDGSGSDSSRIADPWSVFRSQETAFVDDDREEDSNASSSSETSQYRWGSIGVYFTGVAVGAIFIVACIFTPSVSLDTSEVFRLNLESDSTFEEAASAYGVFAVVSFVLLKARFVLDTTMNYIGFGFLMLVGFIAVGMTFFIQVYQFFRSRIEQRRRGLTPSRLCYWPFGHGIETEEYDLPSYLLMYKWRNLEIYLFSIFVGVWQLGSIASYAIHFYCEILGRSYQVMAYVGLVEESSPQCFAIQARLPGNLLIMGASFFVLFVSFLIEATAQIRKNVKDAKALIQHEDSERLSLAWHPEKHDGSMRKSHCPPTLMIDHTMSMDLSCDTDDGGYDADEPRLEAPIETNIAPLEGNISLIPQPTFLTPVDRDSTFSSSSSSSSSVETGIYAFDEYGSFL
jgi:hypothetical protein